MDKNTIFVSIASYRDKMCPTTLKTLYEMAEHPNRIFVGICQQNKKNDIECMFPPNHPLINIYKNNIRKISLNYDQAKGPTYARYLCSTLYNNEDFFLQIDSHTLFRENWDTILINMLKSLEKIDYDNIILSTYPPSIEQYATHENYHKKYVTKIYSHKLNKNNIPIFKGAIFVKAQKLPEKNFYIAAGFFFSRGKILKDVPFDPHLPFLFEGEEILYTIRAFTSGYNIFTPNKTVLYHHYTRKGEPKFWDDLKLNTHDSIIKLKYFLGHVVDLNKIKDVNIKNSISKYGLGKKRTVKEYYNQVKIKYPIFTYNNLLVFLLIVCILIFIILIICIFVKH